MLYYLRFSVGEYCQVCKHGINTHLLIHEGQLRRARDVEEERRLAHEERRLTATPRRASRVPSRQRSESTSSNSNMDTLADNSDQNIVIDINNLPANQVSFDLMPWHWVYADISIFLLR